MKPPRKRDTHDLVQIVGDDEHTLTWLRSTLDSNYQAGETVILYGTKTEITAEASRLRQWVKNTLPTGVDVTFIARERSAQ